MQARRHPDLARHVEECCTLVGCFVPCQDYIPLVTAQLEAAADPAAEGASLAVLASLTRGAGKCCLLTPPPSLWLCMPLIRVLIV